MTEKVVRVVFIMMVALATLWWITSALSILITAGGGGYTNSGLMAAGVALLLLGWLPALVYLAVVRVALEAVVALVKIARNTEK